MFMLSTTAGYGSQPEYRRRGALKNGPSIMCGNAKTTDQNTHLHRGYYWDHAITWLDDKRVAVGGLCEDEAYMIDGASHF